MAHLSTLASWNNKLSKSIKLSLNTSLIIRHTLILVIPLGTMKQCSAAIINRVPYMKLPALDGRLIVNIVPEQTDYRYM